MAQQAQDTFVAEVDGAPLAVQKGQVFPDSHPVVKIDAGRGLLFRQLEMDAPAEPKRKRGRPSNAERAAAAAVLAAADEEGEGGDDDGAA